MHDQSEIMDVKLCVLVIFVLGTVLTGKYIYIPWCNRHIKAMYTLP